MLLTKFTFAVLTSRACFCVVVHRCAQNGDTWYTAGSEFVGRALRRAVFGEDGKPAGAVEAEVVGWMPPEIADFQNDAGDAAALWRVRYTAGALAGDEEDLEEHEIMEGMAVVQVQ